MFNFLQFGATWLLQGKSGEKKVFSNSTEKHFWGLGTGFPLCGKDEVCGTPFSLMLHKRALLRMWNLKKLLSSNKW